MHRTDIEALREADLVGREPAISPANVSLPEKMRSIFWFDGVTPCGPTQSCEYITARVGPKPANNDLFMRAFTELSYIQGGPGWLIAHETGPWLGTTARISKGCVSIAPLPRKVLKSVATRQRACTRVGSVLRTARIGKC